MNTIAPNKLTPKQDAYHAAHLAGRTYLTANPGCTYGDLLNAALDYANANPSAHLSHRATFVAFESADHR